MASQQHVPRHLQKTRRVTFLVSDAEFTQLQSVADAEYGGNISDLVRDVLNQKINLSEAQETENATQNPSNNRS